MTRTSAAPLFLLLLCLPSLSLPALALSMPSPRRTVDVVYERIWPRRRTINVPRAGPASGYYPPANAGGSMLTSVAGTFPPGQGEPLNIIVSGSSSPEVLVHSSLNGGFLNFWMAVGFGGECLGQHIGASQMADLGDGNGLVNETAELRWDYGDPSLGTCEETIQGGDHFRYWQQNGKSANSSAYFLASSYEKPIAEGHDIVPNGYNFGRDWLIGNITGSPIDTFSLTNTSTFSGTKSYAGFVYSVGISYVSGLLSNTSYGINHNLSVPINGLNAIDGLVAVLDIKVVTKPANATSAGLPIIRPSSLPSLLAPLLVLGLSLWAGLLSVAV
ncbi:unnamed protein product [Mycena citricolor]|uniref:Uncharacterized protein n=1 Tax=Mycena citricolor TaxID=2018698 RepID=A0AAD2HYX7_9AGAR|nr:unnamed protein product [Mycena citricolor]